MAWRREVGRGGWLSVRQNRNVRSASFSYAERSVYDQDREALGQTLVAERIDRKSEKELTATSNFPRCSSATKVAQERA